MENQRLGMLCFLLFFFINSANSICKITFSSFIVSPFYYGPVIYKYKSNGIPVVRYPPVDENCVFQSEDERLHLTCAGIGNKMALRQQVGNDTITDYPNSQSTYLLHDPANTTGVCVHGGPCPFTIALGSSVSCTLRPVATMHFLNATKEIVDGRYVVGYRLNDIDLLTVYEQIFVYEQLVVTRYRIDPVVQNRIEVEYIDGWLRGLFYDEKDIDFTELYSKEHQTAAFQRHFGDLALTEKYFSDNNSLTVGQLIFTEDTYYYFESVSTHYYENTAPIWKSVYEGNWKTIGNIIRKIADDTAKELEIYVTAWPSYRSNWTDGLTLGNTSTSPDVIPIPEVLVKAAADVDNHHRGIVFHTFNDPHLNREKASEKIKGLCSITSNCEEQHREFKDVYKGYTFCCLPEHSYIFKQLFDIM